MEIRIFCRKGNCQNMLRKETRLGNRTKDILYVHGWIEQPDIGPVCTSCRNFEFEINQSNQAKNKIKIV
jgi:hypothetical protein